MKKVLFTLCLMLGLATAAQAFPDRAVNIIVPFNAGGSADSMVRILAEYMKEELGKPVMVVNRPGASGTIAANAYFQMKNDGYNVLFFPTSSFTGPVFQGRPGIDSTKLKSIGGFIQSTRLLFARTDAPFKTFDEMIAYAKANPGKLKFGTGGETSSAYVFWAMLKKENAKVNLTLFNGGAPAAAAIMGGHLDLIEGGIGSPGDVAASAGKLIRLCGLSTAKADAYPELKTPLEMGYANANSLLFAMFLHKDTPDDVYEVLKGALQKALKKQGLLDKFAGRNLTPTYFTIDEVEQSIEAGKEVGKLYETLGKL